MKALAALGVAAAIICFSPLASAQTRVIAVHNDTASALKCLLDHKRRECRYEFVGSASLEAEPWLLWNANWEFELGHLVSTEYAGSEQANAYTTKYLNGQPADVYDVKFKHQRKTFYIAPPGPDGKIRYMLIRSGAPDDERKENSIRSRIQ